MRDQCDVKFIPPYIAHSSVLSRE